MPDQPFRFLDLPKELRLMVYEHIPTTTRHHVLKDPTYVAGTSEIIFVAKSIETSIMLTCGVVYDECKSVLGTRLEALKIEPLRFIIDETSLNPFASCHHFSIMYYMKHCLQALERQFAITNWDSGFTFATLSFPPSCPEYRSIDKFVNKAAK
jgi:hypothetical protein